MCNGIGGWGNEVEVGGFGVGEFGVRGLGSEKLGLGEGLGFASNRPRVKSSSRQIVFASSGSVKFVRVKLSCTHIFMPHISELDDLFFGLHFIVVSKNLSNSAGMSNLLNHSPQSREMAKNGQFCRIIPR